MSTPRQLSLFPSAQSSWDRALIAVERFAIAEAKAEIARASESGDERESFAEMRAAIDWVSAAELSESSTLGQLADALWDVPEWARCEELSAGAATRVLECLSKRIVSLASTNSSASKAGVSAAIARAHWIAGAQPLASSLLRSSLGDDRFDARRWAVQADVWSLEKHEDARAAYAKAIALDPLALELRWIASERLRELLEALAERHGLELARARLLPEAWLARLVEFGRGDDELAEELRRRRLLVGSRPPSAMRDARLFALLLAEDCLLADPSADRREQMQQLDAGLFARVIEARRRAEAERLAL